MKYEVARNMPVARFYYQGTHTHPVRRTVLVIRSTRTLIVGYELREGSERRPFSQAPIKSYRRNKIAGASPYQRRLHPSSRRNRPGATLERAPLIDVVVKGV